MCFSDHSLCRCRRPSVWAFSRATEWWNVIVPSFTTSQWVQNLRMLEETLLYLCSKIHSVMERVPQLCTSKEEIGHHTVEACSWLRVQNCWPSFWCKHTHCVAVCARVLCCSWDVLGNRTNLFSRPGEVWGNGCLRWEQVGAAAVCWCYWWITHTHLGATGVPPWLFQP